MVRLVFFAVIVALFLPACASAHTVAVGGHVGHAGYRVVNGVVVYGAVPYRGRPTVAALEITSGPLRAVSGQMAIGDVVAIHEIRARAAVILTAPVKGRRRDMPAGTPLVRVTFPGTSGPILWCDIRPTGRILWPQERDCLQDSTGGRILDRLWEADTLIDFLGYSQSGVGYYGDSLPEAAPHRSALPEERPLGRLGFRYCAGDGRDRPPEFALVLAFNSNGPRWPAAGRCGSGTFIRRPVGGGPAEVDGGGLRLEVSPAPGGRLNYKVLNRIPPQSFAFIDADTPLHVAPQTEVTTSSIAGAAYLSGLRSGLGPDMAKDNQPALTASSPVTPSKRRVYLTDTAYLMGKLEALDGACHGAKGRWRDALASLVGGQNPDPNLQSEIAAAFKSGYAETEASRVACAGGVALGAEDAKRQLEELSAEGGTNASSVSPLDDLRATHAGLFL